MLAMHTLYLSGWTLPASRMSRRSDLAETSPSSSEEGSGVVAMRQHRAFSG
ncbi:hypothetical protein M2341_002814 [Sphingobium sp. B7D2B]|nr:hypothetical protein [Sphingobium sp. B7D2B]